MRCDNHELANSTHCVLKTCRETSCTNTSEWHDPMLYDLSCLDWASTSVSILSLLKRLISTYLPLLVWRTLLEQWAKSDQWGIQINGQSGSLFQGPLAIGLVVYSHGPADHSGLRLLVPCEWGYYSLMRIIQVLRIVTFVCQIEP